MINQEFLRLSFLILDITQSFKFFDQYLEIVDCFGASMDNFILQMSKNQNIVS